MKGGFSVEVDHLVLGLMIAPADKTTLSPPRLKRNWDVKSGFGVEGGWAVYTGEGLATFDATFSFWSEEKEVLWDQFASLVFGPPSKQVTAISCYHPLLQKPPFAIQSVQVTEIEGWSMVTPGHWQTRVSFIEYRPVPKTFVPKKAEPGVPAGDKSVPVKPKTAQDYRSLNAIARAKWVMGSGATSDAGFVPPYPGY